MNEYMYAIAGIFDSLVVIIYYDVAMKRREIRGISWMIYSALILTCLVSFFLEQTKWTGVILGWSIFTLFGLTLFYKETMLRRIFHVVFIQILAMIAEAVCILIGNMPWFTELMDENPKRDIELILSKLFFFIFVTVALLLRKKQGTIPRKHLLYLLLVPINSIFVVYGQTTRSDLIWGSSLLGILAINIVVYYILNLLSEYSGKIIREEMLQEQIVRQRENYDKLSQSFKKGNRMLHDFNKHMRQVGQYLEQEEWERASCYLKQMQGSFQQNYSFVKSGNIVIDSILSNLKEQIESLGLFFVLDMHVDKARLHIDDYDLVTILGNISDNVINEIKNRETGEVYFRLETTENELLLHVINPLKEASENKREKNQWFHGLGLENVKETVLRYCGCAKFDKKEDQFETIIMIPYEEEDS